MMTHHVPHCDLPSSGYFDKPFRLLCKTFDACTSFGNWASVTTNNPAHGNMLRVFNAVAHSGQWQPAPVKTTCFWKKLTGAEEGVWGLSLGR